MQLERAVENLKALLESEIHGQEMICTEKFNSVEEKLRLIERQRVEQKSDCVEASTPILCADLVWRPAGALKVGDELIACDDAPNHAVGKRTPWAFRRGVVTANSLTEDDLLRVVTPRGSLLCNPHHPFLARSQWGRWKWGWVEAKDLREGNLVMHAVDVWEVDETWEGGWLAGMLDGEGCLHLSSPSPRISVVQRESETADRIEAALTSRVLCSALLSRPATLNWRPKMTYQVNRRAEILKLLGSVRPPRLLVRADGVWEGRTLGGRDRSTPVSAVEPAGRGTIAELSVSTKTYIAGGFAVHNTEKAVQAALSAAKEAVAEQTAASEARTEKSETATIKSIDQLGEKFDTAFEGVRREMSDLKERAGKVESRREGGKEEVATRGDAQARLMAGAGLLIALVAVVVGAYT